MNKTITISNDIKELDINMNYGELYIKEGEAFSLEIECTEAHEVFAEEEGSCLSIWSERFRNKIRISQKHTDPIIVNMTIPTGKQFEKIKLEIGAAELSVDSFLSDSFVAKIGAGELQIKKLQVSNFAQIASGAGEILIEDGEIHNLSMSLGAGEVEICAAITGDSQISAGVGELVLKLVGSPEDYSATITKGFGSCSVNGFTRCNGNTYGDGPNLLKVSGGVGAVSVTFD